MGREKRRKKLRIRIFTLLAVCLALCLEIRYLRGAVTAKNESVSASEDHVRTAELAGYLQILPFSPEETRAWILPEMGTYLTGGDVDYLLEFLNVGSLQTAIHEKVAFDEAEELSRPQWCAVYEALTEYLGLDDQIQVATIRYLGMLDESRLIADNGNYDCDPDSIDFQYGESYEVYICGNLLLGLYADPGDSDASDSAGTETQASDSGGQMPVAIDIPETVRVLLTQDNHASVYRDSVSVKGTAPIRITDGSVHTCDVAADSPADCAALMEEWEVDELTVETDSGGKICIADAAGNAASSWYCGSFFLYRDENGIRIVNEVDLETYLCGVVPGEMPERFETEALKAQAICARTYACYLVAQGGYAAYAADLVDTTECQVYLPSEENEKAAQAVADTAGMVLGYEGYLAEIYYFSTSCGYTSGMEVWQKEEIAYLPGVSLLTEGTGGDSIDTFLRNREVAAYDSESRYFRWEAMLDLRSNQEAVRQAVAEGLAENPERIRMSDLAGAVLASAADLGAYTGMSIAERNDSGIVTDLQIQFANGVVDLYNENLIRSILGIAMTELMDQNGDTVYTSDMLPSAAISIDVSEDGTCKVYGGGLGHGIGMSQYGANGMALAGKSCEEILAVFFPGTEIVL
ncbi:MAG: SpoIID/LytB domain-containing protein [Clostridiales bacterium]|nr:SpoIID/LytB domain-containing protein [Clostridiales bacterium]